jgi:hypothetical protein
MGQPRRGVWAPDEVVGGHREGELPIDLEQPAMPHLAQAGHRLGPAKGLLDTFADTLRDRSRDDGFSSLLVATWFCHVSPHEADQDSTKLMTRFPEWDVMRL